MEPVFATSSHSAAAIEAGSSLLHSSCPCSVALLTEHSISKTGHTAFPTCSPRLSHPGLECSSMLPRPSSSISHPSLVRVDDWMLASPLLRPALFATALPMCASLQLHLLPIRPSARHHCDRGCRLGSRVAHRIPVTAAFRRSARLAAMLQAMQPYEQGFDNVSMVRRLPFERVQPLAMPLTGCMRATSIAT